MIRVSKIHAYCSWTGIITSKYVDILFISNSTMSTSCTRLVGYCNVNMCEQNMGEDMLYFELPWMDGCTMYMYPDEVTILSSAQHFTINSKYQMTETKYCM